MILLDTNVIIDIGRGRSNVDNVMLEFKNEVCAISAITISELYVGLGYTLEKYGKDLFEKYMKKILNLIEGYTIFNITRPILERAGILKGKLKYNGITIEIQDLIIGATAESHSAKKIITRNPDHFKIFNIPLKSYII